MKKNIYFIMDINKDIDAKGNNIAQIIFYKVKLENNEKKFSLQSLTCLEIDGKPNLFLEELSDYDYCLSNNETNNTVYDVLLSYDEIDMIFDSTKIKDKMEKSYIDNFDGIYVNLDYNEFYNQYIDDESDACKLIKFLFLLKNSNEDKLLKLKENQFLTVNELNIELTDIEKEIIKNNDLIEKECKITINRIKNPNLYKEFIKHNDDFISYLEDLIKFYNAICGSNEEKVDIKNLNDSDLMLDENYTCRTVKLSIQENETYIQLKKIVNMLYYRLKNEVEIINEISKKIPEKLIDAYAIKGSLEENPIVSKYRYDKDNEKIYFKRSDYLTYLNFSINDLFYIAENLKNRIEYKEHYEEEYKKIKKYDIGDLNKIKDYGVELIDLINKEYNDNIPYFVNINIRMLNRTINYEFNEYLNNGYFDITTNDHLFGYDNPLRNIRYIVKDLIQNLQGELRKKALEYLIKVDEYIANLYTETNIAKFRKQEFIDCVDELYKYYSTTNNMFDYIYNGLHYYKNDEKAEQLKEKYSDVNYAIKHL